MRQPRFCGLRDESWQKGRGTQVHGMTRNGTASRSLASPEQAALVASAPSKASRSRATLQRARREASEQALRRALRVSAPLESLEMKPIRSRLPLPVWEHLVKQVLLTFKERLHLPVWKQPEQPARSLRKASLRFLGYLLPVRQVPLPHRAKQSSRGLMQPAQLEPSPPPSNPSSSSAIPTKAIKSARIIGKKSKKNARSASKS